MNVSSSKGTKAKIKLMGLNQTKRFYTVERKTIRKKQKPTEGQIFVNDIFIKGMISKI